MQIKIINNLLHNVMPLMSSILASYGYYRFDSNGLACHIILHRFCFTDHINAGQGLTLKILRPTQQCGGELEELKPVDQNLQYDFNYQQFTYLPEEITVLPVSMCVCIYM